MENAQRKTRAAYATSCARATSVGWSTPARVEAARVSSSVRRTPTCDAGSRKLSIRSRTTCNRNTGLFAAQDACTKRAHLLPRLALARLRNRQQLLVALLDAHVRHVLGHAQHHKVHVSVGHQQRLGHVEGRVAKEERHDAVERRPRLVVQAPSADAQRVPGHVARRGAQRALPGARVLRPTARLLLLLLVALGRRFGPALARTPVALLVLLLLLVTLLLGRRLRVALAQRAQHAPRALPRRRRVLDDLPQRPHPDIGHRLARLGVHVERLHAALELRQPLVELHHAQQREDAHRGAAHQLARVVHGAPLARLVLGARRAQPLLTAAAGRLSHRPAPVHRDAGAQQRDEDLGRQSLAARQPVAQAAELAPRREVVGQRQRSVVPERRVQLAHQLRRTQLAPGLAFAAAAAAAAAVRHCRARRARRARR